jgi:hypothetical protein
VRSLRQFAPCGRVARSGCAALLAAVMAGLAACVEEPFMGLVPPPGGAENIEHIDEPAQLAETFEGNSLGQIPDGWRTAWADEDAHWHTDQREGRTVLVDRAETDDRRALIWEEAGELFNPEVLLLTKVPETLNAAQQWIVVRASGGPGEETGIAFQIRNNGFRIARYNEGSVSTLDGNPDLPFEPDPEQWYWVRLQVEDRLFRGKIWPEGEAEPLLWSLIRQNSDVLAPGYVGVGRFDSSTGDALFDYFAVGVGGESPPVP